MCLICGENDGYLDDGVTPCWGCNFIICPKCGCAKMPYDDVPCARCGDIKNDKPVLQKSD
jgi:hypothetical protein